MQAAPLDFQLLQQQLHEDPVGSLITLANLIAEPHYQAQRLKLLELQCDTLALLGKHKQIDTLIIRFASLLQQPGNEGYQVRIKGCYAHSLVRRDLNQQAEALFTELVGLANQHGLKQDLALVLMWRGSMYAYRGDYLPAITDLNRSHQLIQGDPSVVFEPEILNEIGSLYSYVRRYDKAVEYYQQALMLMQARDDVVSQSIAQYNIGNLYIKQARYQDALAPVEKARSLSVQADDLLGVAYADRLLGMIALYQGDWLRSLQLAERAAQVFDEYQEADMLASQRLLQAEALLNLGQLQQAQHKVTEALAFFRAEQTPSNMAEVHRLQHQLSARALDFEQAYQALLSLQSLDEKIFDTDLNDRLAGLKLEFDQRAQAREVELLRTQHALKQSELELHLSESRMTRQQLFAASMLCLLLFIILLLLRRANTHLQQAALHDGLTGLLNRTGMLELLAQEHRRQQRYNRPFTLVMFDADHFKLINDRYGHLVGDQVLKTIVNAANETLRSVDLLARFGGEEFLALLPDTSAKDAVEVVERLRQSVAALPADSLGIDTQVTISIGYAESQPGETLEQLIHRADTAMYRAKQQGRNRVIQSARVKTPPGLARQASAIS